VLIFVAFRHIYPDYETMKDVKEALSGNNIEFSQLKEWNIERCRDLIVEWWTRDEYHIGLLVEGTQGTVFFVEMNI